jgi:hypothetical protein
MVSSAELDILMMPSKNGAKHPPERARYIKRQMKRHGFFRKVTDDPSNIRRSRKIKKLCEECGVRLNQIPSNMSDWLVVAVLEHLVCGARTKGSGQTEGFCLRPPTDTNVHDQKDKPFARCWTHGGRPQTDKNKAAIAKGLEKMHLGVKRKAAAKEILSLGDDEEAKANLRHAFYVDQLLPGERELFDAVDIETLDDEIRMTKLRLRRLQIMQSRIDEALLEPSKKERTAKLKLLENVKTRKEKKTMVGSVVTEKEIDEEYVVPNYNNMINQTQSELARLVKQRYEQLLLINPTGAGTAEEKAEAARRHLNLIMGLHTPDEEDSDADVS